MNSDSVIGTVKGSYNSWGDGNAIAGWLTVFGNIQQRTILIEVILDGKIIGKSVINTDPELKPFRFHVVCDQVFRPIEIINANLKVYVSTDEAQREQIFADLLLMKWMAKLVFRDNLFEYLRDVEGSKYLIDMVESKHGRNIFLEGGLRLPDRRPMNAKNDLTSLQHHVGTICRGESAILGRNGVIFVYQGSNKLFSQYQESELTEVGRKQAENWIEIFNQRTIYFRGQGIEFLQTIIPEKSSLLPESFPLPIVTPTRVMAAIEDLIKVGNEPASNCFVSILDEFRRAEQIDLYYLKNDSHFAARGAMAATRLLLSTLASKVPKVQERLHLVDEIMSRATSESTQYKLVVGDLAIRFFDTPLYEEDLDIRYETLFSGVPSLEVMEHHVPVGGVFNGLRMVWRHDAAPLDICIVAFGNSYFADGITCTVLSWWFKHLCKEFHFIWSKEVDRNYVEMVRPDAVIAQTIERFLPIEANAFSPR